MHPVYGKIAGIDVHKKVLYAVIAPDGDDPCTSQKARFGATSREVHKLADWLAAQQVTTVVMESTALYWRPVWMALEKHFRLLLAQARSNAAVQGRKSDYADALRLVKRLLSDDLKLSFVPEAVQRDWRALTRTRVEYGRDIIRWRNRIEGILEEGCIKISSFLSDVLGVSGRRMLRALIAGRGSPQELAALGVGRLRASEEELADALTGDLRATHRLLLEQHLDRIEMLEAQAARIDEALQEALREQQDAIARLCEVPGIAVNSAQQMIAEIGPKAASFPTAGQLASWIGVCPGREESAGVSRSDASAKGNRSMRRILNQCAWGAARTKGSYFEALFRRFVPRLGVNKAIWAIAHRLLRLVWRILHLQEHYQEQGPLAHDLASVQRRFRRLSKELTALGYTVRLTPPPVAVITQ
jgi:transposase